MALRSGMNHRQRAWQRCSWQGMNILVQGIFPLRLACWVS